MYDSARVQSTGSISSSTFSLNSPITRLSSATPSNAVAASSTRSRNSKSNSTYASNPHARETVNRPGDAMEGYVPNSSVMTLLYTAVIL